MQLARLLVVAVRVSRQPLIDHRPYIRQTSRWGVRHAVAVQARSSSYSSVDRSFTEVVEQFSNGTGALASVRPIHHHH